MDTQGLMNLVYRLFSDREISECAKDVLIDALNVEGSKDSE